MTINELIKEMEEEYAAFLEGTGLDDPLRMEKERKINPDCDKVCTANEMTLDILRKYQQLQDDYESRLKADMVAMITEIQTEIKEVPKYRMTHDGICVYREAEEYISDINKVIQQKIEENKE